MWEMLMECPFGVFSSQAGAWRKTAFPDCRIFNGFIIRYFLGQRVPFRISPINKNKFMKCLCILGVLASLATAQAATVLSTTTKDDPSTLTSGGYGAYYGFSFDLDHMLLSSGEGISPNSTVFLPITGYCQGDEQNGCHRRAVRDDFFLRRYQGRNDVRGAVHDHR